MTNPTPLKLTAKIAALGTGLGQSEHSRPLAIVHLFQNGLPLCVLTVDQEHAEQIVDLLNAGTDLLAALQKLCDVQNGPPLLKSAPASPSNWTRYEEAWNEAMDDSIAAIAKAEPKSAAAAGGKDE